MRTAGILILILADFSFLTIQSPKIEIVLVKLSLHQIKIEIGPNPQIKN